MLRKAGEKSVDYIAFKRKESSLKGEESPSEGGRNSERMECEVRSSERWFHKNGTKKSSLDFLFMFRVISSNSSNDMQGFYIY